MTYVKTHAIVKCNTLVNHIKGSPEVMNMMKKSQIWVKARVKGGTTTKTYIGFLMGSNPGMSSKVNLEYALKSILQDQVNDPEVFIESKKVKEFNSLTKEVFDADAWHVYVKKAESREASKLLLSHLASDHQNKTLLPGQQERDTQVSKNVSHLRTEQGHLQHDYYSHQTYLPS